MKTLLFSFFGQGVYKNLFFFEESVFERLMCCLDEHPDMRLVIAMTETRHFDEFFARHSHPRFIVEKISFGKHRSLLQRALRFFYSYFVYTGTTRVMATIGIRPDEPPAGGKFKRFLGPVKILISKTFGRSRVMRERIVPWLYYRIFPVHQFGVLFDRYQPNLVFMPHLYGSFDQTLLAEARRRGVKTMGMISNWDHFDKYYLPFKPDILLAQSEQIKGFAVRHQWYDPAAIFLVGYPSLDVIVKKRDEKTREETLVALRLPPDARYMLYISGSAYCRDEPDIIQDLIREVEKGRFGSDTYVVVRPYAGTRPADRDVDKEKFDRFLEHPRVRIYAGEFWGNVEKTASFVGLVQHAAVVHVVYSTAALEAALLDRPLVAPTFDGYHKRPFRHSIRRFEIREHFRDVLATGALKPAYSFEDLYRFTEEYLNDPGLDAEKRRLLCEKLCYRTDGRSSERIFQHIIAAV